MNIYYKTIVLLMLILLKTQIVYPQWLQTNGPGGGYLSSIVEIGTNIFASGSGNIYHSTNHGTNWAIMNNGLPNDPRVAQLALIGTNIFAGTYLDGVFLSSDFGSSWEQLNTKFIQHIECLAVSGTNIFAGTDTSGVYLSTNDGIDWTQVNNGIPLTFIHGFTISGLKVFAVTDSGVFLSTNNGIYWTKVNNGLFARSVAVSGTNIFEGTENGILLSTDSGTNWAKVNNGLNNTFVYSLAISGNNIFAGTRSGVYRSTDNGANWSQVGLSIYIYFLYTNGNYIFASGNSPSGIGAGRFEGVFLSDNNGIAWQQIGLPIRSVNSLKINGSNIFAAGTDGGVYLSTDNGSNWTETNLNMQNITFGINAITTNGPNVFAGDRWFGIFLSTNNGINWTHTGSRGIIYALVNSNNNIYAGTQEGVTLSTDNGSNWLSLGLTSNSVRSIALSGTNIFAGTDLNGIYLSTNVGKDWVQVNSGLINTTVNAISIIGDNIYAGTAGGVFHSTSNGAIWIELNDGLSNTNIHSFAFSGTSLFASSDSGVYILNGNGKNWTSIGLNNISVLSLVANETNIFAGTDSAGVWRRPLSDLTLPVELSTFISVPNGRTIQLNWSTQTEKNSDKFDIERETIGTNWKTVGFVKASVLSNSPKQYSFTDKNLQSGQYQYRLKMIDNDGTFKYSNVIETEVAVPMNYELSQNFPNPWNPSTKINYNLPLDSKVILEVYNITGVRIVQLVNEDQSAGYYSVDFGSSKLSSGIYFYRITAIDNTTRNNFSAIKKMIVLK